MKVLMIGSAGYVGSIVRPAIEAEHDVWHLDRRAVPGRKRRSIVGDLLDETTLARALRGKEAVVYLALGVRPGTEKDVSDVHAGFDINVLGLYQVVRLGLDAGVRRFVLGSSLSVYEACMRRDPALTEDVPTDAFYPYGVSKRVGEYIADVCAQAATDATILSLRLMLPRNEADWVELGPRRERGWYPTGPEDTRALFAAALRVRKPGHHIIQATGDVKELDYSHARARKLLKWSAKGR